MKMFTVGIVGLAIVLGSAPVSALLGSGGTAAAFGAVKTHSYDSKGKMLTRGQLSAKKEAAATRK